MPDHAKEERILFLLKVWFYFKDTKLQWPKVVEFVEAKLRDELDD